MIDPNCAVQVGIHNPPYWATVEHPDWIVCDRHKRQYDTSYDDYQNTWIPAE